MVGNRALWCNLTNVTSFRPVFFFEMQPYLEDASVGLEQQLYMTADISFVLIFVHTLLFMVNLIREFFDREANVTRIWGHLSAISWSFMSWTWIWLTHPWLFNDAVRASDPEVYQGFGIGFSVVATTSQIQQRGWILATLTGLGCLFPIGRLLALHAMDKAHGRAQIYVLVMTIFLSLYLVMLVWSTEVVHVRANACIPSWCVTAPQCAFGLFTSVTILVCLLALFAAGVARMFVQTPDAQVPPPVAITRWRHMLEFAQYCAFSWIPLKDEVVLTMMMFQTLLYYLCISLLLVIGWTFHIQLRSEGAILPLQTGVDILLIIGTYACLVNTANQIVLLVSPELQ